MNSLGNMDVQVRTHPKVENSIGFFLALRKSDRAPKERGIGTFPIVEVTGGLHSKCFWYT